MAHSKGDDDRDPAEVEGYWKRDPIRRFATEYPEEFARLEEDARAEIDEAVTRAEASPYPESGLHDVPPAADAVRWVRTEVASPDRIVNLIQTATQ